MPYVQLAVVERDSPISNFVILADKGNLDRLTDELAPHEMVFLRQAVANDVKFCFFPRENGALFVRLMKPESDRHIALEDARLAGNELLAQFRHYKIDAIRIRNLAKNNLALAFAEGMALGSYQFLKYFTKADKQEKYLKKIGLENDTATEIEVKELKALLESVFLSRTLVNEPFSYLDAPTLAEEIKQTGVKYGFDVEILGKEKIESLKMGGLLAVNRASETPPCFCILEHKPAQPKNAKPIVLIGKGVVYDTGGLSIKPSEGMDYMKCDMAGAAVVIGTIAAAAQLQLPLHIIGLIPATDNKIGSRAMAPGDVIKMYSGKTVEVVNTDAEGRIILADALHYAIKYKPELVIDFATLTGSALKAIGYHGICYMGTASKKVKSALEDSGWNTYERLVEMPLWKEYGEELKSNIADLKNLGSSNAGMITAGKFLEHFINYPWLHLDIAGPAYLRAANGYRTKDGTGFGVRLMVDFLKKRAQEDHTS